MDEADKETRQLRLECLKAAALLMQGQGSAIAAHDVVWRAAFFEHWIRHGAYAPSSMQMVRND